MKSDEKFCCYGTYNPRNERCLVKCPFEDCKYTKYIDEKQKELSEKEVKENGESNEG